MGTEHCCHSCGHQPCDVTKQLREALKFYADPERYKMDPDSGFIRIQYDGGEAARLILAAAEPGLVEGHSGNVERRSMRGTLTSEALSGDAVPPGTSSEPHTARES